MEHVQHCVTIDQTSVEIRHQVPEIFGVDVPDREEEYRSGRCYFCGTTRNRKSTTQCIPWGCYEGRLKSNAQNAVTNQEMLRKI